ncbi:MAG: tyrosine-type recombinase/integrase [Bacteroidia bacterium]
MGNNSSNSFLSVTTAAADIDVNEKEYLQLLDLVRIKPIPPTPGVKGSKYRVTIDTHEEVKDYLRASAYKMDELNVPKVNKDFDAALDAYEQAIKTDDSIPLVKRRGKEYYTPSKIEELKRIISEVNKKINQARTINGNGYETIKFNDFVESTYMYSKSDLLPRLRIRESKSSGYDIYMSYTVLEEKIKNGRIVAERVPKQSRGLLNRTPEGNLYWNAIFMAMHIYQKIKTGYVVRLNHKGVKDWELLSSMQPRDLFLIPTLKGYLEHFKTTGVFKPTFSSSINSDIDHLIRFLHKGDNFNGKIEHDKLNHSVKFLDLTYQKVTKFKEFLRTTKTSRTKKPPKEVTIRNIISDLGTLVTKILQCHEPSIQNYVNPFLFHRIPKGEKEMHEYYTSFQKKKLMEGLRADNDSQLLTLVHIMYYTGCRRVEAERLRVGHIDLVLNKIKFVKQEEYGRTKTRSRTNTIHPNLAKVLQALYLDKYDKNDFLFSAEEHPGPHQVCKNYFQRRFKAIRDRIPELSQFHGLYGLKHTMSINFLRTAKDELDLESKKLRLSNMLGHSSFKETEAYITKLDLSALFVETFDGLEDLEEL